MHKFNYFCSIILMITLPLMIFVLSSNLVLRVSAVYTYHFNDSQVIDEIPYNVTSSQMAEGIASYWSSFSKEAFQVYEENGAYQDPVFEQAEQKVMKKVKNALNIELAMGVLYLAVTFAIYIYLHRSGFREALHNRSRVGLVVGLLLLIAHGICWNIKKYRLWLYSHVVGIDLAKDSTLAMVMGYPFFKTYVIFSSILGLAILAVVCYVNYLMTKPSRIFY